MSLIMNGTERDKLMIENNQFVYLPEAIEIPANQPIYNSAPIGSTGANYQNYPIYVPVDGRVDIGGETYFHVNGYRPNILTTNQIQGMIKASNCGSIGSEADCIHSFKVPTSDGANYVHIEMEDAFEFAKKYKYCWLIVFVGDDMNAGTTGVLNANNFIKGMTLSLYEIHASDMTYTNPYIYKTDKPTAYSPSGTTYYYKWRGYSATATHVTLYATDFKECCPFKVMQ